jgi:hypothetical protein
MPATAAEATREHPAPADAEPEHTVPTHPDLAARDWPRIARALAATDDDDVPLFGRSPA